MSAFIEKRVIKYPLNKLYYVIMHGYKQIALSCETGNRLGFKCFDSEGINYKVEVIDSLQNTLKENDLEVLLLNPNGEQKQYLSSDDIDFIEYTIKKREKITEYDSSKYSKISSKMVNIACDLLGFNISVNPSTNLNLNNRFNINEVIVSASKLKIFKNTLYHFVSSSLLTEQSIILLNNGTGLDYRISRALKVAKIDKEKIKENTCNLLGRKDGSIEINGILEI